MPKLSEKDRKKQERKRQKELRKKIISTFKTMGFRHYVSEDKKLQIGDREIELDNIFSTYP